MIDQFSKEFALFFEKIRLSRNIKQEDFTKDILSVRQYRRYLKGESVIPQYVANQLSQRLGYNPDYILREFNKTKDNETELVQNFYNAVVNKDNKLYRELKKEFTSRQMIDFQNQLLKDYAFVLYRYMRDKISQKNMIKQTKAIIGYPEILEKKLYSPIETLVLTSLLQYSEFDEKDLLASKIDEFLSQKDVFAIDHNNNTYLLCLYNLSKYYGLAKDYKNVISACNRGISYNLDYRNHYLLDSFYYYSALAYYRTNKEKQFKNMLAKCYAILLVQDNKVKFDKFTRYTLKDFNIDFKPFVLDYLSTQ